MNPKNFFGELKRRNVYKVAVAYAIVAWRLIKQRRSFFRIRKGGPWVMKVFVVVILFGFPVALVLSWAFEITPEGIKREKDVVPQESITTPDRTKAGRNHGCPGRDRSGLVRLSIGALKIYRTVEFCNNIGSN